MASLPRVRQIEEDLRKAQVDPRLINVVCMIAERQRVAHQQMYEMASMIVKMQDLISQLITKMGVRDEHLRRLGVEEMLKDFNAKGVTVESVESFDEDHGTEGR